MAMFAGIPVPEQVQKSIDATKCEYRNVGRSGLRVSVPMLGFMSFGTLPMGCYQGRLELTGVQAMTNG